MQTPPGASTAVHRRSDEVETWGRPHECHPPDFDTQVDILDPRFPLAASNGYLPERFAVGDCPGRMPVYNLLLNSP